MDEDRIKQVQKEPVAILKSFSDGTKVQYMFTSDSLKTSAAKFVLHKPNGSAVQINTDDSIFKKGKQGKQTQISKEGDIVIVDENNNIIEKRIDYLKYMSTFLKYSEICTELLKSSFINKEHNYENYSERNEIINGLYNKLREVESLLSAKTLEYSTKNSLLEEMLKEEREKKNRLLVREKQKEEKLEKLFAKIEKCITTVENNRQISGSENMSIQTRVENILLSIEKEEQKPITPKISRFFPRRRNKGKKLYSKIFGSGRKIFKREIRTKTTGQGILELLEKIDNLEKENNNLRELMSLNSSNRISLTSTSTMM
eukprot:snap_masked-scaffold_1-processed-gene-12.26-mRNA-1 protein AED:1.00 eAED:1.00 QI:0/-1/0/0/-1/1/1/0/314